MGLRLVGTATMLSLITVDVADAQPAADLQRRDADTPWPTGFDPIRADAFNQNQMLVEASCGTIHRHIAARAFSPEWLTIATDVRGPTLGQSLVANSRFGWKIFSNPVDSVVYVAEPGRRFGYTNTPPGPPSSYAQSWRFTSQGSRCLVTTEEIGMGRLARAATTAGDMRVHIAHDLWLASLRWPRFESPVASSELTVQRLVILDVPVLDDQPFRHAHDVGGAILDRLPATANGAEPPCKRSADDEVADDAVACQ